MVERSSPAFVPNSEVLTFHSKSVDQEYRIPIALPMDYAKSQDRYPVLYILDADFLFSYTADVIRGAASLRSIGLLGQDPFVAHVPNLIVVSITYPISWYDQPRLWWSLRTRDQTPTPNRDDARVLGLEGTDGGNAGKFLRFIKEELMPYVNANYRTVREDSTIVGHSGGGLFALYVLFHEPERFRRYVVSSPSLWWDKKVTFKYEREYASRRTDLPARLFLSVGSLEDGMVTNLKELVAVLKERGYSGLEWESRVFEGETHFSVGYPAIYWGSAFVFAK